MNSKIVIFVILTSLVGCGVKAKPLSPPEKAIPSYIEKFTGTPLEEGSSDSQEKKVLLPKDSAQK